MKIFKNINLAECTSFGSGGKCDIFAVAESSYDLFDILGSQPKPFWILGKGANSLISDKGLPGTTIHIQINECQIEDALVTVGAGHDWDLLVQKTIEHSLWGLEHMSGIPGSVGGAVVGNIAAYGQAVSDTLVSIEVLDINHESPQPKTLSAEQLTLGYRSSILQKPESSSLIVTSAVFGLSPHETTKLEYESATRIADEHGIDYTTLQGKRETIMLAREKAGSLLDKAHPQKTAGSFFKNPIVTVEQAERIMQYEEFGVSTKQISRQNAIHGGSTTRVSAAHVLLAAGFKRGQTWGPVRIHPDHILKIENTGGASSQQIYDVALEIVQTVKSKLGIDIEPEVRFMGDFS